MKRRSMLCMWGCALVTQLAAVPSVRAAPRPKLALSLPIEGVQSEVARDLLTGYQLSFDRAEDTFDFRIRSVIEEDRSTPSLTARNFGMFAKDRGILAASGIVGTPHAEAALPVAEKGGLPVIGIRSGAEALRNGSRLIFHLRLV